jgi:hypothetical protein
MDVYEKNLRFLSYGSEPIIIPKEHIFLNKYFKTKVQRTFLKYFYIFRDKKNFVHHTGILATQSFICKMAGKFVYLLNEFSNAKKNLDLEKLALIQRGKFKVLKKFY